MRIVMVNDTVYPYFKGGAPRRVYEIGRRLAKHNHVVWLGMDYIGLYPARKVAEQLLDGIHYKTISPLYPIYINYKRTIWQALKFGLRVIPALWREKYDVCYCTNFPCFPALAARLVCWLKRKPMVLDVYEVWGKEYWQEYLGKWRGLMGYTVEWLAARTGDRMVADGEHVAMGLATELGLTPKAVAADGADVLEIQNTPPAEHGYDVIFVGRLMEHKNIELLVTALWYLKQSKRPVTAVVVGDGDLRDTLRTKAVLMDVHIVWKQYVDDLYGLMKACRVFVHPSLREGSGCVFPEATAAGLPIVAVDAPENSARYYIGNDPILGYLCKPVPYDMGEKIMMALNDKYKVERSSVCWQLDWGRVADEFERQMEAAILKGVTRCGL